jgi:hypothetical protein
MIPACAGPMRQGVTEVEIVALVPHKVISLRWFCRRSGNLMGRLLRAKKRLVLVDQPKCRNRQYNQRRTS